jgi:hypothetical protein
MIASLLKNRLAGNSKEISKHGQIKFPTPNL